MSETQVSVADLKVGDQVLNGIPHSGKVSTVSAVQVSTDWAIINYKTVGKKLTVRYYDLPATETVITSEQGE